MPSCWLPNPDINHLTSAERGRYVQEMFTRIARRYGLMNRLMSVGQDARWRREVIRRAALPPGANIILDLGAGTADVGLEALRQNPAATLIEADFSLEMMKVGRKRASSKYPKPQFTNLPTTNLPIHWAAADALQLPFPADTFDAVVSGFLLRNVVDLPQTLREQHRVLKSGGMLVALDTTRPRENLFSPLIRFHMHTTIPLLGRLLTGEAEAYTYLPDSSECFLPAEELAAHIAVAGFREVCFWRLMFGTIAIHWGRK
ncbi:MAG: ubiquinone/menaquinone biosynthesis methyltransferase [Chloroflexi bacterium]|nr:ubiquinone/menaquinone biosynthesis methyltransferase [Chloroflexota bacterium]MBU1662295.1 ubiquinone/menaquinone biosynthesis methyltransferase [Chloroflexota bacterium]